jgi:diguanylate cyclase (GGDEF)-like protein
MVATDGELGLTAARANLPDLILLDVTMPGISGHDVCRALKEDPATQSIPIIFITALVDADDETHGFDLGAADYITKPFNHAVVKARVRTQLRLKAQADLIASYAFRDGLTGLHNRRSLDQKLEREWHRCQRSGLPLSVALLDVDHFKLFNDTYGHGTGDECLKAVGAALKGCIKRSSDMAARYGGEEFAIILPECDPTAAAAVAEEVRNAIEALAIGHSRSSAGSVVTVSVGIASLVPSEEAIPTDLWVMADRLLYRAKEGGRNRVALPDSAA